MDVVYLRRTTGRRYLRLWTYIMEPKVVGPQLCSFSLYLSLSALLNFKQYLLNTQMCFSVTLVTNTSNGHTASPFVRIFLRVCSYSPHQPRCKPNTLIGSSYFGTPPCQVNSKLRSNMLHGLHALMIFVLFP